MAFRYNVTNLFPIILQGKDRNEKNYITPEKYDPANKFNIFKKLYSVIYHGITPVSPNMSCKNF